MYRKPMLIADYVDEPNDELSAESEIKPNGEEEQEFEYDENDESDGEGARSDIDHAEVSEDEEEEEEIVDDEVNVPMRHANMRIIIQNSSISILCISVY